MCIAEEMPERWNPSLRQRSSAFPDLSSTKPAPLQCIYLTWSSRFPSSSEVSRANHQHRFLAMLQDTPSQASLGLILWYAPSCTSILAMGALEPGRTDSAACLLQDWALIHRWSSPSPHSMVQTENMLMQHHLLHVS